MSTWYRTLPLVPFSDVEGALLSFDGGELFDEDDTESPRCFTEDGMTFFVRPNRGNDFVLLRTDRDDDFLLVTDFRRDVSLSVWRTKGGWAEFLGYDEVLAAKVLAAVQDAFHVEVVSEDDGVYWGDWTEEEWNEFESLAAAEDKFYEQNFLREVAAEHEFYERVMHYVRGEDHDLQPGTIGMIKAGIAKELVDQSPDLALPEAKGRLLEAIESVYSGDGTTA